MCLALTLRSGMRSGIGVAASNVQPRVLDGKFLKIMKIEDKSKIWYAVVNVFAASKKAASLWKKAEEHLKIREIPFHSRMTGGSGNAMEITFDACAAGYRRFVAVGGDGTVHDVLNGIGAFIEWQEGSGGTLSFADFTLGVIPVGSGNDWIKTAGIPRDIPAAVDLLLNGRIGTQDVVRTILFDGSGESERPLAVSYMANVAGVGIDARVCGRVNMKKKQGQRGRKLYVGALLYAIRNRVPAYAKVLCDGREVFDGPYLSMAFGVGKYSGGGMRQTPEAVLDDGLLDMTLIPDLPLMRIAREVPRLFTGTFLKVPELVTAKSREITVCPYDMSCAEPVEVDGEVIGKAPVRFEVMKDRINIVAGA